MASDRLQRFLFDDTPVRGEIAQLEDTYRQALARHGYPPAIERLLGELMAACSLLTATVKRGGILSIEIRGEGALTLLMTESSPGEGERAQQLRAVARYDENAVPGAADASLKTLAEGGRVPITIDPRQGRRYQGFVALDQPTIAGCLEGYFAQSEQLPTRLWLAGDTNRAAGLLLQKLPEQTSLSDPPAWDRINHLADTLTANELTTLDAKQVLYRLFREQRPRLFEPAPVRFACSCSRERFGQALHRLGAQELRDVLTEQGEIDTQCHCCNTVYTFSPAEVEAIIDDPDAQSPTVH